MSDESSLSRLVKQVGEICSNKLQYAIKLRDISFAFVLPVNKLQYLHKHLQQYLKEWLYLNLYDAQ